MPMITITVVPPAEMRYATVGDWQRKADRIVVTVAQSGDSRSDLLVGLHEAIEAVLCDAHNVTEKDVDAFDFGWKNDATYDEPGDDPAAPYHSEHVLATIIERMIARELGMTWEEHSMAVERA